MTLQEALMEADRQQQRAGVVWDTVRRVAARLDQIGVPYAVVGGIALQHFGIGRSTKAVNILVSSTAELARIHGALIGHGYVIKSPGSRHLRDEVTRVRVEFLIGGEYPGDGLPKPVAFPTPAEVGEQDDSGLYFVNLHALIEMKLASAKSAAHRIKDRADVLELIHTCGLTPALAESLNAYVRDEFLQLVHLPPPSEPD